MIDKGEGVFELTKCIYSVLAAANVGRKSVLNFSLLFTAVACCLLFCPGDAPAAEIVPFHTFNQSPLVQIHGLPPLDSSRLVDAGRVQGIFSVDAANNFVIDADAAEQLTLDGETYRLTLAARYGLVKGVELGLDVPIVTQSGGFLDGFIEGFHRFFGLPRGGREDFPRDRLLYNYSVNGDDRINVRDSATGLGDVRVSGALQLYREEDAAVALRASVKLPTGSSGRLHGSGSTDFALWLSASEDYRLPALGHLTGFGGIGGMAMTGGDVLKSQQRTLAGFGSLGIGWSPLQWLALKVQANGHTSLYQGSELKQVDGASLQLVSGGTIAFGRNTSLDIGVSEDIIVETSPDVVFTLTLRTLF